MMLLKQMIFFEQASLTAIEVFMSCSFINEINLIKRFKYLCMYYNQFVFIHFP